MKKRLLSLLLTAALCLTLLPTAAWAEEAESGDGEVVETSIGADAEDDGDLGNDAEVPDSAEEADEPEGSEPAESETQTSSVDYVYAEDRSSRKRLTETAECTYLVSSDTDLVLDGEWYAVTGSVTIDGNVTFTCPKVNLILCSTSSQMEGLTINGTLTIAGQLNIYGQTVDLNKSGSVGSLTVKGGNNSAIAASAGNAAITFYGGSVRLSGSPNALDGNVTLSAAPQMGMYCSVGDYWSGGEKQTLEAWENNPDFNAPAFYVGQEGEYHDGFVYKPDGDDHHLAVCKHCGYSEGGVDDKGDPLPAACEFSDVDGFFSDETNHYEKCLCGNVSKTGEAHVYTYTGEDGKEHDSIFPTEDLQGHVSQCAVCGYENGTPESHTGFFDDTNTCTKCGFVYIALNNNSKRFDDLDKALHEGGEQVYIQAKTKVGPTQVKGVDASVTFDPEDEEWEKPPAKSVELYMSGCVLYSADMAPALTVNSGTLAVTDVSDYPTIQIIQGGWDSGNGAAAVSLRGGTLIFNRDLTASGGYNTNGDAQYPAVAAYNGTLSFNKNVALEGGLYLTGSATLATPLKAGDRFYAKSNSGKNISNTKTLSIEGSTVYTSLLQLLADGCAFAYCDAAGNLVDANGTAVTEPVVVNVKGLTSLTQNVIVVAHEHKFALVNGEYTCECGAICDHSFENGKCTVCGYVCPHDSVTEQDGKYTCDTCGTQFSAKVTDADGNVTYYADGTNDKGNPVHGMFYALKNAPSGSTIKALTSGMYDVTVTGGRTLTLDMNGTTNNGGSITLGVLEGKNTPADTGNILILTGNGKFVSYVGGQTVYSTLTLFPENTLIVDEHWNGDLGQVRLYLAYGASKEAKAQLSGGTFQSIGPQSWDAASTTAGSYLVEGYAFRHTDGEKAWVRYDTELTTEYATAKNPLENVEVVKCVVHVDTDNDKMCDYCNTDLNVSTATLTTGGATYYYTDLQSAVEKANTTGGTITLQKDVTDLTETLEFSGNEDVIFELNGHSIIKLNPATSESGFNYDYLFSISGFLTMTIRDSNEDKTGKIETNVPGGYPVCVSFGTLTIEGGEFKGAKHETYGTEYALEVSQGAALNITGGTFKSPVSIKGGIVRISGGTFEHPMDVYSGSLTVTGGTFKEAVTIAVARAEIKGGTFEGAFTMSAQPDVFSGGTFKEQVTFNIGGGTMARFLSGGTFEKGLSTNYPGLVYILVGNYLYKVNDHWEQFTATSSCTDLVTVEEVPIHSPVTLMASSSSKEYGKSQEITLYATCTGTAETAYATWYCTKEDSSIEVLKQTTGKSSNYTLPEGLSIGNHTYYVSFSDKLPAEGAVSAGYSETAEVTIEITKVDLANAEVTLIPANGKTTYNPSTADGSTPKSGVLVAAVTVNGKTLSENTDYTVSGNTTTEGIGTYKLTIHAAENSNYTGSQEVDWEVIPFTLYAPRFMGNQTYTKTYDGTTTLPESYTFYAHFSGDPDVELNQSDYEVTSAAFVSADAGENKPINQSITLKNKNFVFAPTETIGTEGITTTEKTITYTNWTPWVAYPTLGTTFNIEKADVTMTDAQKTVTQDIINDLAHTYEIDLPALPELESPKTYGDITYSLPAVQLNTGYYTIGNARLEDGKLFLTIDRNPVTTTGSIGSVTVTVSSTNYKDVTLTVNLSAVNKREPVVNAAVVTDPIVYGMTLGDIKPEAKASVGDQEIPGTVAWDDPLTTIPSAGRQTYSWTFTPDDTDHYLTVSGTVSFLVDKATPTGEPKYTAITSGGKTLADAALTANESWPDGTVQWVDQDGKVLADTTQVQANTAYTWKFTPADTANYNGAAGSVTLYTVTSTGGGGGGGGGSSSSSSATKTETVTNSDGSVTKTETKPDGTVIQTTTAKDGSTTRTETKPDGSSITQRTTADGSTGTVRTDANGNTRAEAKLSGKAVEAGKKSGEAVPVPIEVRAGKDASSAPTVKVELPQNAGETKIEIPVENVSSGTVAVLVHEDGTETLLKDSLPTEADVQLTVEGTTTVKILDHSKDFSDTKDHWAKDAIDFVSARGLVSGVSGTTYAPDAPATRAQLWTILARWNNVDLTGGATWFEKAQTWSKTNGISDGANPNGAITRAQMVTMLWRAAGSPAAPSGTAFSDVAADSYYTQAVAWAVEHGITSGVGSGRFDPNGTCTRAQIAAFLMRCCQSK